MFFDKNIICKGKEYIGGKVEGVICFNDAFAMRKKRDAISIIPVIFNNHRIGVESVINCDGIIVFEGCMSETLKEIIDKIKVPCVLIPKTEARVEKVSVLIGKSLSAIEGERIAIDGKKVKKIG